MMVGAWQPWRPGGAMMVDTAHLAVCGTAGLPTEAPTDAPPPALLPQALKVPNRRPLPAP